MNTNEFTFLRAWSAMILMLSFFGASSQDVYRLSPKEYRLGKIENWQNDTLWFTLTNTSQSEWYILPQFYSRDYQVIHSRTPVQAGRSARIGIVYYTEYRGEFDLKIPIYINTLYEKIELRVKGNIRSIDPRALVQCPTINHRPEEVASKEEERVQVFNVGEEESDKAQEEYAFEEEFIEEEELEDSEGESEIQALPLRQKNDPDAFRSDAIPNNIVLVLDRSRSMNEQNKMDQLKLSLEKLIRALRPQDRITMISYSRSIEVHCEGWGGDQKNEMIKMVQGLSAEGGSYGSKGMDMAYKMVAKYRIPEGNNAIILATDGKFNDKDFSQEKLMKKAKSMQLRYQISLSGLAYGEDPRALKFLEELSESGKGKYIPVASNKDQERMILNLVKELSGRN